jgi:multidrug efflux pump subunit AcrB
VEFEKRHGKSSAPYLTAIRESVQGIPGVSVEVDQETSGPPTDPPVNIELVGDDFDQLAQVSTRLLQYLDKNKVEGISSLKADVDLNNPEITIAVDRARSTMEGISTAQIGMALRTAQFGKEVSKVKDGEDEYKIQLRYAPQYRGNVEDLLNQIGSAGSRSNS